MSALHVVEFKLEKPRLTDYGRALVAELDDRRVKRFMEENGFPPIAGGASFSDYLELKLLDHIFNDGAFTAPSPSLALCTSVPDDTKTGSTIVEANYTGYARLAIAAADMSAAASGSKTNSAVLTFAACTAGSSTIIGWAICDAATVGNALVWGTCTSTVISTTQTPATVAASGLVVNLD